MRLILALLFTLGFGLSSMAVEKTPAAKETDIQAKIQMHEHMAELNKNAAECLKAGKSEKECHDAMMMECKEHCKKMTGDAECPMMKNMEAMGKHWHGGKMKKGN